MSTINTNGIDVNYPEAGKNNPTQGFRDNWAAIKTSIDTASSEITDLQSKAVVKSALANTTINNDMGNTLISNAATRGFRATTYNLGNALSGTVLVDVSRGDVQYGTIAGNVSFQFGKWATTGTQSNIQLKLAVSNSSAHISWPAEVVQSNNNFGVTTLENYSNVANVATISFPYNVSEVDYRLSTTDCGNSITIEPYNRPRQSTQIQIRTPSPVGFPGDVAGATAIDPAINQLSISDTTVTTDLFTTDDTTQLLKDMPIIFTGVAFGGPTVGTTYYVRNVVSSTTFTVSSSIGGGNLSLSTASSPSSPADNMYANPIRYSYICTDSYDATAYAKTVTDTTVTTNDITLNNTTSLKVNSPVIFTGTTFGGLLANTVYYVKTISSPNITVSLSRTFGNAGSTVELTTASGSCTATIYVGSDIWKRTALTPW